MATKNEESQALNDARIADQKAFSKEKDEMNAKFFEEYKAFSVAAIKGREDLHMKYNEDMKVMGEKRVSDYEKRETQRQNNESFITVMNHIQNTDLEKLQMFQSQIKGQLEKQN